MRKCKRACGLLLILAVMSCTVLVSGARAKTFKITVVAGHPPIFLWVTLTRDFFIPEVDKRLAEAGGQHQIVWNQAYGGTVAKIGGALEAIEEGVADMGFVGTLFEAPKMPLHNVSYMTPFGTPDIMSVVNTVTALQAQVPEMADEWTKHNQVYLGGAALDSYGVLSNFPIKTVADLDGHKLAAPGPSANWIKGTGAVAVAANLNTYYNGIQTGVFEGTLTFMTAASAIKVHEVAPYITITDFGAQFAGGLSINKDVFDSFPAEVQKIFVDVGREWSVKLARAQAERASNALATMEQGGAKVYVLPDAERVSWAAKLPNVPMEWAASMEEKGLPGKKVLAGYLEGISKDGARLPRDWNK
jgi:TRAP-type C4-dicarboxylate transport system substrate-binding protein